ncbi:hypothetical protein M409DRAFT_64984 [Zasmidium cellare ATCC 36951]|uniref:Uncharacterized protein n=1 Tax=Zasmidium cellare ATCC 36951 TaxID=1080233 RepID=A0A6A6CTV4_ZASCE|nr:uncharacterized protein M409DRAFT_64984 [Zasmidium cellare ATCC 36951]KAF2169262.1 hypothetical protein M409DRAFT_64984 [Zasmidium cellare ATCC 36951]
MPPPGSFMRTAARNDDRPSPSISSPVKLTLATRNLPSKSSLSRDENSASPMSSEAHRPPRTSSRQKLRDHTDMSFPSSSPLIKSSSTGNHAKLHKRGGSASSLPGPPSPFTNAQFQTPFATYEESFPEVAPTPGSSVPQIKPYLRKMSVAKEDQGMIDLSKSAAENERLNGLGIQDFGSKSAADVSFAHTRRGQPQHGRTTSGASQGSTGSGGFRAGQPFTHPMAKTPRPYTPPTGSYANSINENEADESDDVVEDEFRLGGGFRTRRSISISSTPQPTPLSQSHTASDLGLVPKLTSSSQTNLSLKSAQSSTGRPRRNTDRSQEYVPSPSSRTSFDKAFSFAKRSELEPQTREEMIREARRKFEEKEANKDRKHEKDAGKRRASEAKIQERQRQKSEPSLKSAMKQEKKPRKDSAAHAGAEDEKRHRGHDFQAMSYEEQRPAMLPRHGSSPGESERRLNEKGPQFSHTPRPDAKDGGWLRFSTWVQTRMLSCGGSRD